MNTHETNQRVVGQDGPADPEMRFAILVQAKIPYNPTAAHQSDCWHVWERWRPRSLEEKPPVIGLEDNGYRLTKHSRELLPLLRTVRRFNADELMRSRRFGTRILGRGRLRWEFIVLSQCSTPSIRHTSDLRDVFMPGSSDMDAQRPA